MPKSYWYLKVHNSQLYCYYNILQTTLNIMMYDDNDDEGDSDDDDDDDDDDVLWAENESSLAVVVRSSYTYII